MKTTPRLNLILGTVIVLTAISAQAFYDPHIGRFASRDPIGQRGGANLYVLVGNNPVALLDPLGLLKFDGCTEAEQNEFKAKLKDYREKLKTKEFGCCLNHVNIPQRLQGMCAKEVNITIRCIRTYTDKCNPGDCSWSLPGGDVIRMCPDGLAKTGVCADGFGCVMMHELTHMVGHGGEKWPRQVERCLGCKHWND